MRELRAVFAVDGCGRRLMQARASAPRRRHAFGVKLVVFAHVEVHPERDAHRHWGRAESIAQGDTGQWGGVSAKPPRSSPNRGDLAIEFQLQTRTRL